MFIIGAVFWVVGIAISILVAVITYLTPALFHAAVYLEGQFVQGVEQLTGYRPAHGLLILLSLAGWGGVGAIVGTLFLGSLLGVWPALVLGVVCGLWGAAVGHQVGMRMLVMQMRRPGFLPHQTPGTAFRFTPQEWVVADDGEEGDGVALGEQGWPQ